MSLISRIFHSKRQNITIQNSKSMMNVEKQKELLDEDMNTRESQDEPSPDLKEFDTLQAEYEVLEREIHPAKIICPDCGGITLEGFDFCDKCGGELLQ